MYILVKSYLSIYVDVMCITRSTKELPLTPFKRPENGAKERTAVPFLSTPVSVKKARYTYLYSCLHFMEHFSYAKQSSVS